MGSSYRLRAVMYGEERLCYELIATNRSLSELERWESDPKRKEMARSLYQIVSRIKSQGLRASIRSKKLTPISSQDRIYEIKNFLGPWREMSCIIAEDAAGAIEIVLLFAFRGHQGSDGIPSNVLDKACDLAKVARDLLSQEGASNGN